MAGGFRTPRLLEIEDRKVEGIVPAPGGCQGATEIDQVSAAAVDDDADRVLWMRAQDESIRKIWDNQHDAHWDSV